MIVLKFKKNIWIKGYNRRWDGSLNDLKNNFLKYSKDLGNLLTTEYSIKAGNTYLDQKHHSKPVLKSKFLVEKKIIIQNFYTQNINNSMKCTGIALVII